MPALPVYVITSLPQHSKLWLLSPMILKNCSMGDWLNLLNGGVCAGIASSTILHSAVLHLQPGVVNFEDLSKGQSMSMHGFLETLGLAEAEPDDHVHGRKVLRQAVTLGGCPPPWEAKAYALSHGTTLHLILAMFDSKAITLVVHKMCF